MKNLKLNLFKANPARFKAASAHRISKGHKYFILILLCRLEVKFLSISSPITGRRRKAELTQALYRLMINFPDWRSFIR